MNFLAHLYLSGASEDVCFGNFLGDFIKGKQAEQYNREIQIGVQLHRIIDDYTDSHPIVERSKARLRPKHHKFAPVIVDVFYDHFLASSWQERTGGKLLPFTQHLYTHLQERILEMPPKAQYMLPFMVRDNWLYNYRELEGIGQALNGLSRRATFENRMNEAVDDLQTDYSRYQAEFDAFFPQLEEHVLQWLKTNI